VEAIAANKTLSVSDDLGARRTGMAFQRTRLAADRTLMAVIRTSLSLISFGFTIAKAFEKLHEMGTVSNEKPARNFGLALVGLGIAMLVVGIVYHVQFMLGLRHQRRAMKGNGILHAESKFPPSMTLITALILLLIGIVVIISLLFHIGPFG
jgi:inner membrane protein YidH